MGGALDGPGHIDSISLVVGLWLRADLRGTAGAVLIRLGAAPVEGACGGAALLGVLG